MNVDSQSASPLATVLHERRRRRPCLLCVSSCGAALLLVAVILLILAFTVFKVKEPIMTMNSVTVQRLDITSSSSSQPFAVNMTVVADVSVRNPNAATVRFGPSTTALYYRGREMGVARGPPGTAGARRTFRLNVTVHVTAGDRIFGDPKLFDDLAAGSMAVETSTRVGGRLRLLGPLRRHVDVLMNCSIAMAVANQSIVGQRCTQRVWL